MKVPVHRIVGDACMTCDEGARLQHEFREAFDRGETVELDFEKTRIFGTVFFNAAVGSLLENYSHDELEQRLKIVNLPPAAKELLDDSLDNADRYYHHSNFPKTPDIFLGNLAA
jgi:STAS-like domain of unknown function (DUF4325)